MAIECCNGLGYSCFVASEPHREKIHKRENNKRLTGIGSRQNDIQFATIGLYLLGQLGAIGVNGNLIEPNVTVHLAWHHTDVVITRIGHAIIAEKGLNRLIAKDKSSHHYYFFIMR